MPAEFSNQALGLDDFMCNVTCEEVYSEDALTELFPDPMDRRIAEYNLKAVDAVAKACGLDTGNKAYNG